MDPKGIATAGMGATAGGGILSAFGALSSGIANSNMFGYQSAVAKLNQQIDNQNAEFAIQTGEQQATISGLKAGQQMGQIKVAQASAGFDVRSGSNKQVQDSQVQTERLTSDIIRSNAAKTAYNFETQANIAGSQADMYGKASSNALVAGAVNMGSSILGTASSVSNEWLNAGRLGMVGSSGSGDTSAYGIGGYSNYGSP